ncbi:hypothetical protein SAMN04488074_13729 [Lentzea albidocapillata subsp. violacea]|uniref:RAMA domain-containing protein n=1 Tax=Lentzea albidocapillata subsp. violacea TaxID=128104 RepID=A0A1G9Z7V0_9PSEU|nr:hypothetical protein [Lentzea albidocapillata]SDN16473.1 hypothetical protein SAMN04488074_13729 [Lentzea albidocapillata subsp. violacea]
MARNSLGTATPTDYAFPSETVLLAPAPLSAVPLRPPAGAWGLVVVAVRTTAAATTTLGRLTGDTPDPARTDTADLMAGVWLPTRPPAHLHTGDVVVRLQPPCSSSPYNPDDPTRADAVILAAAGGEWCTIDTSVRSMGARWPHEAAPAVLWQMRYLADAAYNDAQWATLAGPIAAALPPGLLPAALAGGESAGSPAPRAPDALAELIDAGLVEVGEQLVWNGHTATVQEGGVLHDGGPHEFAVSTVTALATSLAGYTVNGWHLWRRARDNRPLSDLRTALATR